MLKTNLIKKIKRETVNANLTNTTTTLANNNNNKQQSRASMRPDGTSKFSDYNNTKMMSNTISGFAITKEISEEDFFDMENFREDNKSFKSGIKLNTKYGTSLRTEMEKLDLIPEFEESEIDGENAKKLVNNFDLFKKPETSKNRKFLNVNAKNTNKNRSDAYNNNGENNANSNSNNNNNFGNKNNEDLEEINKFNNAILKNANWGQGGKPAASEENAKNYVFHKPDKREIEREIGKNIYNTKLPRARLLTKIKDPGSNSFSKVANKTGGAFGAAANSKFFGDMMHFDHSLFNKTVFNEKSLKKK